MASSWTKLCFVVAFIIFAKCANVGVGYPVIEKPAQDDAEEERSTDSCTLHIRENKESLQELEDPIPVEEYGCDIKWLATYKSKLGELSQKVDRLINTEKEKEFVSYKSLQKPRAILSGLLEFMHAVNRLYLHMNGEEEGSTIVSGSGPYGEEKDGSADAGSATSCNPNRPQVLAAIHSKIDEFTREVENLLAPKPIVDKTTESLTAFPSFDLRPKDTTAYVNDNLWLHCSATGDPKISWIKEEDIVKLDKERFIQYPNGTLHIINVRLEDQGRYYCIAENHVGLIQSKFSLVVQTDDQVCPHGWVGHGHSCYHIIDIPTLNWRNARTMCQQLGGDLGKISTYSENQFIYNLLREQKTVTHYGVWLGLHRKADNKFYWIDDTPLTGYTAWGSGEPNNVRYTKFNLGENCVHKIGEKRNWPFRAGEWNDVPCDLSGIVPPEIAPVVLCQKQIDTDILSF